MESTSQRNAAKRTIKKQRAPLGRSARWPTCPRPHELRSASRAQRWPDGSAPKGRARPAPSCTTRPSARTCLAAPRWAERSSPGRSGTHDGRARVARPPGPSAGDAPSLGLLLEAERAATLARLRTLRIEFDGVVLDALDANLDDEHDPEVRPIAWERAQLASLIDDASSSLADLDEALQRLERGTSATCERCGGTIAAERLEARPGTRECIRCAWFGRTR